MSKYCVYSSSSVSSNILFFASKWVLDTESEITIDYWVWMVVWLLYSDKILSVDGSCIYSLSGIWSSTSISWWDIEMSYGINFFEVRILIGGKLGMCLHVEFF